MAQNLAQSWCQTNTILVELNWRSSLRAKLCLTSGTWFLSGLVVWPWLLLGLCFLGGGWRVVYIGHLPASDSVISECFIQDLFPCWVYPGMARKDE